MLAASLVLLIVAVVIARSGRASVAAAAPVAARTGTSPALLEAVDAVTVRASAATAGVVRRAVARGAALGAGEALVELRRPNPVAAQRLTELNGLLDEYDEGGDHTAEIARARAAYERAMRIPATAAARAPFAGIVVGEPPRPGATIASGNDLARLAASVRLVVPAADVDGSGPTCRVVLLDRPGALLDGRLLPPGHDGTSRAIMLGGFQSDLPLGMIGRVRAICP
jgi:hypothetical protein